MLTTMRSDQWRNLRLLVDSRSSPRYAHISVTRRESNRYFSFTDSTEENRSDLYGWPWVRLSVISSLSVSKKRSKTLYSKAQDCSTRQKRSTTRASSRPQECQRLTDTMYRHLWNSPQQSQRYFQGPARSSSLSQELIGFSWERH